MLPSKLRKNVYPVLFICCQELPPSTRVLLTDIDLRLLVKLYARLCSPQQSPTLLCLPYLSLAPSVSCSDSVKESGACLGMNSGPCMLKCVCEKEKKRSKNDLERIPKAHQYAYVWVLFVCVSGSAVVLQVQSRCLSFFCSSPTSINRSVCVLQFLRGFVLFPLFFSLHPYPLLPSSTPS